MPPRSIHNEQDKDRQEKLKKTNENIGKYPKQKLFFFNESWFGVHSKVDTGDLKKASEHRLK
ncbi:hypothetical protein GO684_00320 [Wolbachia endosymbiont of Litomosoides brasiliensis]|uniref:hypothetical protein n=1 Tax=Wolbachia endosymbiont of Litomosoides brasiliensis TaxID=1812117 RepID=UPI001589422B|nr:hypothetical protein [Wolbachia endosymbiont of Litomosoides brasiliensis]NUY39198.1 hypothetical protein [Wolbachia endosymbiont of Litomosoides brasiliensis]